MLMHPYHGGFLLPRDQSIIICLIWRYRDGLFSEGVHPAMSFEVNGRMPNYEVHFESKIL